MRNTEILTQFENLGALTHGHFRLSSGRHSDTYIQCAAVLQYPRLFAELLEPLLTMLPDADVIVSPAVGAIAFGNVLAHSLGKRMIFAERVDDSFTLRRGFTINSGEKVLIAEDVITTGGSVSEIAKLAESSGGEVAGIAAIVNRGESANLGYPIFAMLEINVRSYVPDDCELCRAGVPIDTPGSRFV